MTRIVINENKSVYVDGYRHILKYNEDEIVLKLTKVNIYKTLNDLLKSIQSNEEIIAYVNDNITQLLLIFNNNYNNQ